MLVDYRFLVQMEDPVIIMQLGRDTKPLQCSSFIERPFRLERFWRGDYVDIEVAEPRVAGFVRDNADLDSFVERLQVPHLGTASNNGL